MVKHALITLLTFLVIPLHAADVSDLTFDASGDTITITDCDTGASGTLIIPGTIEGKPVTSIGVDAFFECEFLTSVTIPDSVTSIGRKAFRECPAVVEIRPATQNQLAAQLAAVTAERDARFTEDQIRTLSADYTIGLNDAGNVQIKINFFESSDLTSFTPFTVNPESLSVVDGKICLEFAPAGNAAFFRFSVE